MIGLDLVEYKSKSEREKYAIDTGFHDYDTWVCGLKPEEITVLYGRNGEGKTTVISQWIAYQINTGQLVYLFSGELGATKIQDWFYTQVIGSDRQFYNEIDGRYKKYYEPKESVIKALKKWHAARFFIFELDKNLDLSKRKANLFNDMLEGVYAGCKIFYIDNMFTAMEANADSQWTDQTNFINECRGFAIKHKVHLVIVAHSKKEDGELTSKDKAGTLRKNDIMGSSNIPNAAMNIVAVERVWHQETEEELPTNMYDLYMTNLKDKEDGKRAVFKYTFDPNSLRFYNNHTPKSYKYDWEKYLTRQVGLSDELVNSGFERQL